MGSFARPLVVLRTELLYGALNRGHMSKLRLGIYAAIASAALVLLGTTLLPTAQGADHLDSPAAIAEPLADLTDVYAWVGGTGNAKLRLALAVSPNAGAAA